MVAADFRVSICIHIARRHQSDRATTMACKQPLRSRVGRSGVLSRAARRSQSGLLVDPFRRSDIVATAFRTGMVLH